MSNENSKATEGLSWRRYEVGASGMNGTSTPRGGSRGRGRGRGGRGRVSDGGPGRPESSPRSGRRRGAPKQADAVSTTNPPPSSKDGSQPPSEDKSKPRKPKGAVGDAPLPKLNADVTSSVKAQDILSPVEGVSMKNGSKKLSSRQSHRRTKSAVLLKPSPIIVVDKSVRSVVGSPSTPVKDLPPHFSGNSTEASGLSVTNELVQVIEHVASDSGLPVTASILEGHIDWAQDDDDEELPDLDDWGITTAKVAEDNSSDTASRCTADSGSAPTVESSASDQRVDEVKEAENGSDNRPPISNSQLAIPQVNERHRTRGRERNRGAGKPKDTNTSGQDASDYEVPRLPNGQKKSLIDRIGPSSLLSLPHSTPTRDGSPPKSAGLPHHPSLPPKPSASPFASSFGSNSLSLKPMSDWKRSTSRSRSPSKEPPVERQTSTLDSIHAPANLRTPTPTGNVDLVVEKADQRRGSATPATAGASLNVQSLFQGNSRPHVLDEKPRLPNDTPRRPRRDRSPPRNQHGPRNHSAFQPHGSGTSASSRPSRSRQTNAARPVISVDALQRISRSLKGSPTPPRHASPAPNHVAATATATAAE
ncbi:hypothetical protein SCHPADRAFT_925418 [Schizopora paradoxa]|uniref:Uncharacterized protein n=1 Tax=Schizopora paradoxa TaxID=27342 RepID=A0A0H2S8U6_9AGAM|nr:hypothetical protein SCHPADRAFT_925418 [Schizopora paradoxa]